MIVSILCGGSGTRLWPISRELMPKQFASLLKEDSTNLGNLNSKNVKQNPPPSPPQRGGHKTQNSLFKLTLERNAKLLQKGDSMQIITNDKHFFLAQDEAKEYSNISSYILESIAKNTAAALTLAALLVAKKNPNEIILTLPSDHIIHNFAAYKKCVQNAKALAAKGYIVTFGIRPSSAHTGYGYIQVDSKDSNNVLAFHEKPDIKTAQNYLKSGNFYWNSGMFCYKANVLLDEMKVYEKDIYNACVRAFEASLKHSNMESNPLILKIDKKESEKIKEKSIDYAVMEKTKKLKMIIGDFEWNDVGSFDSLVSEYPLDTQGNATTGECELLDSKNNLIISDKLVAAIGLNDFVVIDSHDALLIAKKGQTQDVKKIVESLSSKNSELIKIHRTAFRPWGSYTVLLDTPSYKLKSILVKPKQRLSLQKHYHRNEHWIIVSGSAIVQVGDKEIFLKANESTYIPMGEVHRLSNPGLIDLVMIEVQVGEYLGEDDIVRISDDYKRE